MMAESVVTFFLRKLDELLTNESNLISGVKNEINSLQSQLQWIRSFLKDADKRSRENERVKIWVSQVRDALYDAERIIDDFILQTHNERHRRLFKIRRLFRPITQFHRLHSFGTQIKVIKENLDEIYANKSKYGVGDIQEGHRASNSSCPWKERVANFVEETDVVGIEDDMRLLLGRLIASERRRAVISIVGMGGLGKTTLAKKVYNDVKGMFKCSAWISVSQEYNVRALVLSLIRAIMFLHRDEMDMVEKMDNGNLGLKLADYLEEKKYLIVVDDIWSMEGWDALLPVLPDGMNGSRVILTSRNKEVALYADALSVPHDLKFLPETKCWELFCKKAFPGNAAEASCPPELERWGKEIVAKCGGLPLAIIVLGGMLSRKEKVPSEWEKLYKSINWQLQEGQNHISGILGLSYNDLPYYLKPCFLYCGIFPEDSEFSIQKLIRLWIAEGFIEHRGAETMEEVAEDYLWELIQRSMIQVAKKSCNGSVKACRVHDLLRELAISEAVESKFFEISMHDESLFSVLVRRLVVYHDNVRQSLPFSHLRTLLRYTNQAPPRNYLSNVFSNANYLRVIDLEGVFLTNLPRQIGKLVHLRYVGLRKTRLTELPSSIGNLFNLRTLDIRETSCKSLPKNLLKHRFLRHLCMAAFSFQDSKVVLENALEFPEHENLGNLRNLETLTGIIAGNWISCSLEMFTNLRHLGIGQSLSIHVDGLAKSLSKLHHLHSLWLQGEAIPTLKLGVHHNLYKVSLVGHLQELPTSIDFPPNLTKLCLQASDLMEDPSPILMKLPKLKVLRLVKDAYCGNTMSCMRGGFLELEELVIQLPKLKHWIVAVGAFPKLRSLSLIQCDRLMKLPIAATNMRSLQELNLLRMPGEFLRSLQEHGGDDYYKIEHIPTVIVRDY